MRYRHNVPYIFLVMFLFFSVIPNSSEAARRLPICAEIKVQSAQPLHVFEYGETQQKPSYAYGLFLRDGEYMGQQFGKTKSALQKYIKANTKVVFIKKRTVTKKRKDGTPVVLTEVQIATQYKKYSADKKTTRTCYIAPTISCPIISINDSKDNKGKPFIGPPEISCASPDGKGFASQGLQSSLKSQVKRIKTLGLRCAGPGCPKATSSQGKHNAQKGGDKIRVDKNNSFITKKQPKNKGFTRAAGANKRFTPISDTYRTSSRRPQRKEQGGSSPISGFIKQLQGAFKQNQQQKAQENARKAKEAAQKQAKERAEYQARLRLSQCNPAHPYYLYNKKKCTGGDTKDPTVESHGTNKARSGTRKSSGIDTLVVRRGTGASVNQLNTNKNTSKNTNKVTLAGINAQKCKDKKPKALVVARPKAVESGQETTIKWASVCTASCKLTAQEVGIEGTEPILTELGTKGEVTGKLYNDTRFDLKCKDFKGNDGAQSGITVKLKK